MQRRGLLSAFASLAVAASAWASGDGVTEINAVRAVAGSINGNPSLDPPFYPVTITQPGSYRLTSNLSGSGGFTPPLIEVTASNVTIDLNGFALSNAVRGIDATGSNVTVRNGSVFDMADISVWMRGPGARVESVRVSGATTGGIVLTGTDGLVSDSIAVAAGAWGIVVPNGTIRGCVATGSGTGFNTLGGLSSMVVVVNSAAIGNADGVITWSGSVEQNLIVDNSLTGLTVVSVSGDTATGFARNVISGSGTAWTGPALQTGPNVCNGNPACP
jgi:hypothetical protein